MSNNLKKFICPKFTRTIDPVLMARLFERHRDLLGDFDLQALRGDADGARGALEAFFAGPEERCPDGLGRGSSSRRRPRHRARASHHARPVQADGDRHCSPERSPDGDRAAPGSQARRPARVPRSPAGLRGGGRHAGAEGALEAGGIRRLRCGSGSRSRRRSGGRLSRLARQRCSRPTIAAGTAGSDGTRTGTA